MDITAVLAQQSADLAARDERHERKRVVTKGFGSDKRSVESLLQFLDAPTLSNPGAQDASHTGATHEIDGHARLAKCLHDADVREPARTAAGEHQPNTASRQHPGDPRNIFSAGDVMVWNSRLNREPPGRGAPRDAALVEQDELRSLRGHARLALTGKGLPAPRGRISPCEQQQRVCLPDAKTAPAARSRVANIHD